MLLVALKGAVEYLAPLLSTDAQEDVLKSTEEPIGPKILRQHSPSETIPSITKRRISRSSSLPDLRQVAFNPQAATAMLSGRSPFVRIDRETTTPGQLTEMIERQAASLQKIALGPSNFVGAVLSGVGTVHNYLYNWFYGGVSFTPHPDPSVHESQIRVSNISQMLKASDISAFTDAIKMYAPLNTIETFYKVENKAINDYSLEEVMTIIDSHCEKFSKNIPVCIPIIIKNQSWGISHIVAIFINNGIVEYSDSKGVASEAYQLADNNTLKGVLEYCKEKFEATQITENPFKRQYDINNCGVFVCNHIYRRMILGATSGSIPVAALTTEELNAFRCIIISQAFPLPNPSVIDILQGKQLGALLTTSKQAVESQFEKDCHRLGSIAIPTGKISVLGTDFSKTCEALRAYIKEVFSHHTIFKLSDYESKPLDKEDSSEFDGEGMEPAQDNLKFSDESFELLFSRITRLLTQGVLADMTGTLLQKYDDHYCRSIADEFQTEIIDRLKEQLEEGMPLIRTVSAIGGEQHVALEIDLENNLLRFKNCSTFQFHAAQYDPNDRDLNDGEMPKVLSFQKIGKLMATRTISISLEKLLKINFEELSFEDSGIKVVDWFSDLKL